MNIVGGTMRAIIAVTMIVAVVIGGYWLWQESGKWFQPQASNCDQPATFVVKSGESVAEIITHLQAAGVLEDGYIASSQFRLRLSALNAEKKLQAGSYELNTCSDTDTIIRTLITPVSAETVRFTVIEGWRLEEIAEHIGISTSPTETAILSPTNFLQLTTTHEGAAPYIEASELLTNAGIPEDKGLEGFLFPDTYDVVKSATGDHSDAVIKRMIKGLEDQFGNNPEMASGIANHEIDGQPVTLYQVITLAAIVQREAAVEAEMPDIAQVYWNRIAGRLGQGVPRYLDADPTIQYAIGKPGAWWPTLTDLARNVAPESEYNTTTHELLPPGPIANPGLAAIKASILPSGSDYLYFVAKCDGSREHYFARTLEEQTANQAKCP